MKKIIINGANGFVASNFIYELLNQDYEVVALVRGNSNEHAKQRMLNSLEKLSNGNYNNRKKLTVYNYSLLDKDFLIPTEYLPDIFRREVDYFHFAASLKYNEKTKDEIFKTNIDGVENSIDVFQRNATKSSRFFYISTAYSCGRTIEKFEERFYENEDISVFRNYYEQSKRFAENIIRKHIEADGLNAYVLRPSQVVGNNSTGVTKTDFGIFDFTKRVCNLAVRFPNETVKIIANPDSTQNLIPIDTVACYLMSIVETQNLPRVINLVAKQSVRNSEIINYINETLPINIISCKQLAKHSMTSLERLIDIGMSFTGEYCNVNLVFDTTNLDATIAIEADEITQDSLRKMLGYFIGNLLNEKITRNVHCAV